MITNRKIDELLLKGSLAIDPMWGLSMFEAYMEQGYNLEKGHITLADIKGINQKALTFGAGSNGLPDGKIAIISMSGVMQLEDSLSTDGARTLGKQFQAAYDDPEIVGIRFNVNSGGGELMAGQEINRVISGRNKPVHVVFDLLASAAYLATMGADSIMASGPFSRVGSIGTMTTINKEKLEEYKAKFADYYANQATDKNLAFKSLLNGDATPLIAELTSADATFIEEVKKARKITNEKVFAGAVYTVVEGIELGLIDGVISSKSSFDNHNTLFNMNFENVKANLARIFGWTFDPKATEADVEQQLADAKTIAQLQEDWKANLQLDFQGQLDALTTSVNAQKAETTRLTGLLTSAESKITDLTTQADALATEKGNLELEIVNLKATDPKKLGGNLPNAGDSFLETLNHAQVDGESKY